MRLLVLSPNYSKRVNWGHQHIRDALLARVENSVQYGEACEFRGKTYIPDICEEVKEVIGYPDTILMENWNNMSKYSGGAASNCFKAFMLCDYYPDSRGNFAKYNTLLNRHSIDLAICPTPDVMKYVREQKKVGSLSKKLKTILITQGVETNIFMQRDLPKEYDVMAVFGLVSYVYPNRPNVQALIRSMDIKSLVGDWKSGIKHYEYARAINKSKIFVNCNGINNQVLMKYFEVMASGTLLLTNKPKDYQSFGLVPGKHFVVWSTLSDLQEKIYYFLENDGVREDIAEQGMEFVRYNFSADDIAIQIEHALIQGDHIEVDEEGRTSYASGIIGD